MINSIFQKYLKFINKHSLVFILFGFIIVNLVFNYNLFWHELISDRSKVGAVHGEVAASEWGMEQVYQKLIHLQNPFRSIKNILYPFGLDIVASDAGAGFFFIFLRPFLSVHQSLAIIVILNLFLANIGMFFLLKKLGFNTLISFLVGLSYGYTTALMPRIGGHPTYTAIYLFPWFFLSVYSLFTSQKKKVKLMSSLGISFFFVLTLWQNFYFFIILLLSCFSLLTFLFLYKRDIPLKNIRSQWIYILMIFVLLLIFLYPWFTALYEVFLFAQTPKVTGWLGANTIFASDLFGFFIPGIYNYYYVHFISPITDRMPFARGIFENFTYPGIIILSCYFYLLIRWKNISSKLKQSISPYLITGLLFAVLTLGPFLHVYGKWSKELDEGIKIVIPLPYIILHYLPFMGNLRVPGRFMMGFVFFAYIVTAYVLSYILKNKTAKFKLVFLSLFLTIFIIDQRYNDRELPQPYNFPTKIYQSIQKDQSMISVLEIPFSVRDGFISFGSYNSILMATGQLTHGKPIIGGYAGRIPDHVKDYYQDNPFLGYIGRIIDEGINENPNPGLRKSSPESWQKLNVASSIDTVDFLDIKYIILKDESYHASIVTAAITQLGYKIILKDSRYSLWQREPKNKEFLRINMGDNDDLLLGMGWNNQENGFRWVNRRSSVMFKVNKKQKLSLHFQTAAFYKEQSVTIYLNKKKIGKLLISPEMKEYTLPVEQEFEPGINFIYFIFEKGFKPSDVMKGSLDQRQLAAQFTTIYLSEDSH